MTTSDNGAAKWTAHELKRLRLENERLRAELAAEKERGDRVASALELVLPMAKGYAALNVVGSNAYYIQVATAAIRASNAAPPHL